MIRNDIADRYFDWLVDTVSGTRYSDSTTFNKLLIHLHNVEFRYIIEMDRNRAVEGAYLRYRFALLQGPIRETEWMIEALDGPCSILEMMIALAIHCEENIMDDPSYGDRTGQWFWSMIVSLGLGSMTDRRYDKRYVDEVIERFLNREYEPNGKGGLFTIKNCNQDLRDVEIWRQLSWYLGTII